MLSGDMSASFTVGHLTDAAQANASECASFITAYSGLVKEKSSHKKTLKNQKGTKPQTHGFSDNPLLNNKAYSSPR